MSEEQKPDGWVAWHPKCGIAVESFVKTEDQMFRSWIEACTDVALKEEGWRIRPVRLVFLDEGNFWMREKTMEKPPEAK